MENIVYNIISDTFLFDFIDKSDYNNLNISSIQSLLPLIKNFDLVLRFYEDNYDFTNDELIELLEYLRYMSSKRIMEILVVIKCRDSKGRDKINKYLLNDYDNIDINFYINTHIKINNILLRTSIYYNLIDIVKYLITQTRATEINKSMIFASECGHVEIVEFLCKRGADVNAMDDRALIFASSMGHISVVDLLFKRGSPIYIYIALQYALALGHKDVADFLIQKGGDIHHHVDFALLRAKGY